MTPAAVPDPMAYIKLCLKHGILEKSVPKKLNPLAFVDDLGSKNCLGSSDQVVSDLLQVLDGTLSSKLESMFHESSTQNNETSCTVSDLIEKVKPSLSVWPPGDQHPSA